MPPTAILWLRRDLRLDDNPALTHALADGARIVPLYIHAPHEESPWEPGAASRWWLHGSLQALDASLRQRGSRLWIAQGDSLAELRRVCAATGATQVHWNRLYDPATRARDQHVKQCLRADGLHAESHKAHLLFEPWEISTGNGQPYRVFSAFWRACVKALAPVQPRSAPLSLPPGPEPPADTPTIESLGLLPRIPWDAGLHAHWTPGVTAAHEQASAFLDRHLHRYSEARDRPADPATSRLSPHLHFGEIGPRRLLWILGERFDDLNTTPVEPFLRELGWREFAHHLLYHFAETVDTPLDPRFTQFPWRTDPAADWLPAWRQGRTGIPLVDAGMRELWQTGWMHNRVRMVVASFLTKNLRLPWQTGARWFLDTLVDADLACNTLGWQWTAGCGADAAPYFRIFNPVRQGERFDPEGAYVRRWCPELARLPDRHIHQPWTASASVLTAAGVRLGDTYPRPLVDLAQSRQEALEAWEAIKNETVASTRD